MKKTIHIAIFILGFAALLSVSGTVSASTNKTLILDCENHKDNEVIALACNIYHESRGESKAGMWLVALATRNRVEARIYPNTYAEVSWEIRTSAKSGKKVAMYSWTLDGKDDFIYNSAEWIKALHIAVRLVAERTGIIQTRTPDITFGCMWYHNNTVTPFWVPSYHPTVKVGGHQCYAVNEKAYLRAMSAVIGE